MGTQVLARMRLLQVSSRLATDGVSKWSWNWRTTSKCWLSENYRLKAFSTGIMMLVYAYNGDDECRSCQSAKM